ncbi:MAG: hypothetical protein M0R34_00305 [Candidatus Marinimicrobia bacterium]|nr:hypothetical protein [Candidatus Neomarinimicrobiota bacterium]
MKKLIFLILFCLMAAIAFSALTYGPDHYRRRTTYLGSGNTRLDPLYLFMNEIDGYLSGSNALTMIFFDPTTEPTAADKGLVYYDGASNTLKFYNGSAWTALATAAGNSLDLSYDAGAGITVDAGAVTLTTSADSDSAALDIVHGETGAYPALSISNAGTDPAIEITTSGTGADITGTSATWSISKTGAITCVGITNTGTVNFDSADVHFDATDAGKDVYWDDSHETFGFFDNAILGFGNTTTAPDVSIMWDGSNLLIESATEDTGEIQIGSTNAIDVVIYGNTNTKKAMFNANTATLELTDYDVQFTDSGILMFGSDDDFTIYSDTANILEFDPAVAGNEIRFGTSHTDAVDITWYGDLSGDTVTFDEENCEVLFTDINLRLDDDADLIFGTNNDFTIDSDTAATLDIIPAATDESAAINIGADEKGIDVSFFGATSGDKLWWDASEEELFLEDVKLIVNEGSVISFEAADNAVDWTIQSASAEKLEFIPSETDGTSVFAVGNATNTSDLLWYTETAGSIINIDATADLMYFDGVDLRLNDGDILKFGDSDDITIAFDGTNGDLDILGSGLEVSFGVSGEGIDVIMHGETAGEYFMWDESADSVIANCGNVSLTTVDAEANQFKIDATGTVAGYAVVIETTDGGVQIKADGADNGDIAIAAGDDMTLTAGGDLTLAVTGSLKMGGALIANNRITTIVDPDDRILTAAESGSTIVFTMTGGAATCTLPEATADNIGMWFILVDGNPTSGRDLSVDPEGTGTINGNGAGEKITCENDRDGEAVYIFSTAADTWYAVFLGSSTVWTEE